MDQSTHHHASWIYVIAIARRRMWMTELWQWAVRYVSSQKRRINFIELKFSRQLISMWQHRRCCWWGCCSADDNIPILLILQIHRICIAVSNKNLNCLIISFSQLTLFPNILHPNILPCRCLHAWEILTENCNEAFLLNFVCTWFPITTKHIIYVKRLILTMFLIYANKYENNR